MHRVAGCGSLTEMKKSINDFLYNKPVLDPLGRWWVRHGSEVRGTIKNILLPYVIAHVIAFILSLIKSLLKRLKRDQQRDEWVWNSHDR